MRPFDRARRRGDVLLFIGTHARECRFCDAQFQEEISFVHQPLPFGLTWSEGNTHEDVHERGRRSDGAGQPLRAPGPGNESKVRLRQSDQVVTILSDTQIAGERELESTGQACAGNGGDYWFWHALAQRHGLVEESPIVSRVLRPLATGSAQGLCEADKRSDGKMTNEITGRAASHDDNANVSGTRESVQC